MKIENQKWNTDLINDNHWATVPKDILNLLLAQADSALKALLEMQNIITLRAYTLLTTLIPIASISIGNLFPILLKVNHLLFYLIVMFNIIAWAIALYALIRVILPRFSSFSGFAPKDFFNTERIINNNYDDDIKFRAIVMRMLENIQAKIDLCSSSNNKRTQLIKTAIFSITISFTLTALIALIGYL